MAKKHMRRIYKPILFLLIILILMACNKKTQKPDTEQGSNLPKLPKVLTELEDELLTVMYDLDSVRGIEKVIEKQKLVQGEGGGSTETAAKEEENNEDQGKDQENGEEKKAGGKDEQAQMEDEVDIEELIASNEIIIPLLEANDIEGNFVESASLPPNIDKVWATIGDSITDIHKKWNVLEAQLQSGSVPKSKAEEFEQALDRLTLSVADKEVFNSLQLTNELTKFTAGFRSYFDDISNHSVFNMYYYIRSAVLNAASDNYAAALKDLEEADKIGDSMRQDLIKNDGQDIVRKFELSVEDLKSQLTDENFHLTQIKAPIVIKNIMLIQNTFETKI